MKSSKRKSVRHAGFTIRKRVMPGHGVAWRLEEWQNGKLKRETFETLDAAKGAAEKRRDARERIGEKADQLTDDHRQDAVEALGVLKGHASLKTAAECWMRYNRPPEGTLTLSQMTDRYIADCEARNLRTLSIRDIRHRLQKLRLELGSTPVTAIDTATLDSWLDAQSLTPANRMHYRRIFHCAFAWATANDHVSDNPAAKLRKLKTESGMPSVLSVPQIDSLLRTAEKLEPRVLPYLALATFCGIRPTELTRLTWADVDLETGTVTIRPEIAKKRRSRILAMSANCKAWLVAYRPAAIEPRTGIVSSAMTLRRDISTVRKGAKFTSWQPDVLRHCFATYHLALHGDISKTTLDLGHTNPNVLFEHYRNLATKAQATAFFAISPTASANVIPFSVAAG